MKTLEKVTSIAVVIAALAITWSVFAGRSIQGRDGKHPSTHELESRLRGTSISDQYIESHPHALTCVLVLSTECPFCEQNMSFYRELSSRKAINQLNLVAVFPQAQNAARDYLMDRHIATDGVVSVSLSKLRVEATPTVLIIDAQGRILDAWVGVLDQTRQQEIVEKLARYVTNSPKEKQR